MVKYSIGIDPSLTGTGIVVLNDSFEVIEKHLIATTPKWEIEERYKKILEQVQLTTERFRNNEHVISIEGLAFGARGQAMFQLAGLHFLIRYNLFIGELEYKIVPPTVIKKHITGKGNTKKELMLKEIYKKWGVDFNNNNLADAYALARYSLEVN